MQTWVTYPAPISTVLLSVQDQTAPVYIGGNYSTNGIKDMEVATVGGQLLLTINFKKPSEIAPGIHQDVILLRGCLETPCVNQITDSPQTINVSYKVVRQQDVMSLSLTRDHLDLEGFALDTLRPDNIAVDFTLPGTQRGDPRPFVSVSSTNKAIISADLSNNGGAAAPYSGYVNIGLNTLSTLAPGTHADTVTVRACVDAQCVTELPGSPAVFTLNYTVRNVITGPGYRARAVLAITNDMVWDATRQVMYVAIAANAPEHANTIGVLDPVTGTFSSYFPAGNEPGRLALSPDGQYLYVGMRNARQLQRFALPAMTPDLEIPLDGYSALDIQVSPLLPQVIAVVRGIGNPFDLAIFDGAVMRPQTFSPFAQNARVSTLQWDSQNRIFGVSSTAGNGTAYQLGVAPEGLQLLASQPNVSATSEGTALLMNGRMYMQRGRVFDPLTFAQLGAFAVSSPQGTALALDPLQQKAFFLTLGALHSFDANTLGPLSSIPVRNADPRGFNMVRVIRWGYDGLALANHQFDPQAGTPGILLIEGAFVRP